MRPDRERDPGYAALGEALAARSEEILLECQHPYVGAAAAFSPGGPLGQEMSLSTQSIVRWLRTAHPAADGAADGAAHEAHCRPPGGRSDVTRLGVTRLVELALRWDEVVSRMLSEEAERLGVGPSVLHAATSAVSDTSRATLIELAECCDAELESLHHRLADLARRDPLTGLATRAALLDQLDLALARLSRQPDGIALIVVGIDDLATVNERYGRPGADAVLVEVGSRLRGRVRPGDLVARIGHDELAILFEDLISPAEAERRAVGLRASAAAPVPVPAAISPVRITVSAGGATVRLPGKRPEDVLAQAGSAMSSARQAGGDRVNVVEVDRGRPLVVAERTIGWKPES